MAIGWRLDEKNGSDRAVPKMVSLLMGIALMGIVLVGTLVGVGLRWASAHVRPMAPTCRLIRVIRPGTTVPGCPSAASAETDEFSDVAATSTGNAWIVGDSHIGRVPVRTLIVRWDGRTWRRVPSPNATGRRTSSFLNAVAASSPRSAWAVGESNVKKISTLIEQWNGKSWKLVPSFTPNPKRDFSFLDDVAARTRSDAWAVGFVIVGP